MFLQIQSPFLSQVSSGDQWWQYSDPQSCLSVDTGVIEKAWYNWGNDWEGLNQLRKWLRRPEPCNMCCNGLPSSDSWINIMGRRKLFYPTFMSLVFERILREKDSYRKVIVLEEALYCESGFFTLTATPVPHNPAVAVCRWTHLHHHVWYETNPLRSWWHYQNILTENRSLLLNIKLTDLKTTHFCVVFLALSTTSDPNLRENRQWANPDPKS